jgi:deoxyribonuclease-4
MFIGAQVRQVGGYLKALERGEEMGAEFIQLCPQNNRQWRMPAYADEVFDAYREARAASKVVAGTVCHAPYLINLIGPDRQTAEMSFASLVANLRAARRLGAIGLVLHPGSHRGVDAGTACGRIARRCVEALEMAEADVTCRLLLENTAGAGGTVGRSFVDLGEIVEAAGGDERIGICLDSQHLFASGVSYANKRQADAVIDDFARIVGLDRLACLHLNDSKVPCGSNHDRHETLGKGLIGLRALEALLGHPALGDLPCILEVPGETGEGPGRADLEQARVIRSRGVAARQGRSSAKSNATN